MGSLGALGMFSLFLVFQAKGLDEERVIYDTRGEEARLDRILIEMRGYMVRQGGSRYFNL